MAKFYTLLLLCGLAISVEAMGYFQIPASHDEDCGCEPEVQTSQPTTTTPTTTTPTTTTPTTTTTITPRIGHNCTYGRLYIRNPTAANNYTAFWCISIIVNNRQQDITNADGQCKTLFGEQASITLPESADELASIYTRFQSWFGSNDGYPADRWTLVADGHLKPSCSPLNTCSASESFEFSDSRTDPTFILTQWKAGQPDPQYFNGTQKECLGIDEDTKLRNVFCSGYDSPINGTDGRPDYYPHGIICGAPAINYVLPGDA